MKNIIDSLFQRLGAAYHKINPETDIAWQRLNLDLNNEPIIQNIRNINPWGKWFRQPVPAAVLISLTILLMISPFLYNNWSTITICTQYGIHKEITLPDGSTVLLNSGSTLSYERDYNEDKRNVTFQGEALFTVLPSSHPFIIVSGNLEVKVIGTAFNVKNYTDEIEVAVIRGTVAVNQYDSTVTVTKGERIRFEQNQKTPKPERIVHDNYPGWIHNTFIFEKTELTRVCDEIERTFNIQIRLNNPRLESLTVSGEIKADNLDEALTILSFLIQKKYTYKDEFYVIY